MGLYTREQMEQDVRELEKRKAMLAGLLTQCAECGGALPSLEGLYRFEQVQLKGKVGANRLAMVPEIAEEIFRGRAQITCPHCDAPRRTAISSFQYEMVYKEIEKAIAACKNKLAITALTIVSTKKMQRSEWWAWVIGATKEHEEWCRKLRDEDSYCNCRGQWVAKGRGKILIRHNGPWKDYGKGGEGIIRVNALQDRGVTVQEYFPLHKDNDDEQDAPTEEITELKWQEHPIAELKVLSQAGHWAFKPQKHGRCGQAPALPLLVLLVWIPRYMIRYPAVVERGQATVFEAVEVGE